MMRLSPTIPVNCKEHGDGEAIIIIDYGIDVNTVWVVRLSGGTIKHFYSDDIYMYDNPMNGNGWDVPTYPVSMPYTYTYPANGEFTTTSTITTT